jgi:hypothetical protein
MNKLNKMELVALRHDYEGRGLEPYSRGKDTAMRDEVWSPIAGESGTDPRTGMKVKRLFGSNSTVLEAYVLGFT